MTKTYLVVYAKCKGSNFSGHAPDVLGCVSVGDTLDEMNAMMQEALEFHLETIASAGETIPEAVTKTVEFGPDDFEDVEYFIVKPLAVQLPDSRSSLSSETHQAA